MAEGELNVIVKLKDEASKELKGLKGKFGSALKGIGIGLAGAATAAVGFGVASVKAFADAGDEVQKMALRTGFSTEALSELRHALDLSGSSIEAFETGIKKMARFVDDAKQGLSTATDVMDQLGLTVADLEGLSPEEAFDKLSTAIAEMEDPLAQQNAALELFGRAGTDLLPMLSQGAEGIAEMRQEAHDLGLVFDQEAANTAAEFKDNITRLQGALQGLMNEIAKALMPALEPLITAFKDLILALPINEIAELIGSLLPPLINLFLDLFKAIPYEMMFKFVGSVLEPAMILLGAIMAILKPAMTILEPIFLILTKVMKLITPIIEGISWIMENIFGKALGTVFGWIASGVEALFGGQGGAIVRKPTLAMIGEAGPEALIPLSTAPGASALGTAGVGAPVYVTVHVHGSVIGERELAEVILTEAYKKQYRNVTTGIE